MLLFYNAPRSDLPAIRRAGLRAPAGATLHLWTRPEEAARRAAGGAEDNCILAVDGFTLEEEHGPLAATEGAVLLPHVVPEALCNAAPYRPLRPVTAAGGYVVRPGVRPSAQEAELLLIFRRGVWDLPKGKQEPGESVAACALREVREEIGARRLRIAAEAGTTLHGYPEAGRYCVKTTHWFVMQTPETPETPFTPQTEEDIEAVRWAPWSEACCRIGYRTLRRHMDEAAPRVRQVLSRRRG